MAAMLDGTTFVDIDVATFGSQNALVATEKSVNDSGIGLSATLHELYQCIRSSTRRADGIFGLKSILVATITNGVLEVGFH